MEVENLTIWYFFFLLLGSIITQRRVNSLNNLATNQNTSWITYALWYWINDLLILGQAVAKQESCHGSWNIEHRSRKSANIQQISDVNQYFYNYFIEY